MNAAAPRPWPWPRVLAHRGGGTLAPENTLGAIRYGHSLGFRAVEFDAMLPADDVAILMHDPTLLRTTGRTGDVLAHRAAELAQFGAGAWHSARYADERVPLLESALKLCRELGIWANVEIKPVPGQETRTGRAVALEVARIYADVLRPQDSAAAESPDARLPLFSSFATDALVAARAAAPGIARGWLIDKVPHDWAQTMERLGCVSLHTNHKHLDAALAQAIRRAGYWLFCYTVNTPERARQILSWGVDAFCTDRLDLIGADFAARA